MKKTWQGLRDWISPPNENEILVRLACALLTERAREWHFVRDNFLSKTLIHNGSGIALDFSFSSWRTMNFFTEAKLADHNRPAGNRIELTRAQKRRLKAAYQARSNVDLRSLEKTLDRLTEPQ
ncbi:hypothetical protein [Pseudonocardia sp. TMWB2A]|uniref:hypothetical protein n=1 Tax=Pseudonocardia sp. TMWB2A TaxID=687430 RepID=UPI00307E62E1